MRITRLVAAVVLVGVGVGAAAAQSTDWSSQNLNLDNNRYAPLDEIDTANVTRLVERWSYEVGPTDNIAQATPLVVDGVMYLHSHSTQFALDAATGEELWTAPLDRGPTAAGPVRGSTFAGGNLYAYRGADLYATDAATGEAVESFGNQGYLPVVGAALQQKYPDAYPPTLDPVQIGYRITTPPAFHDGTLYVAAALSEGHIPGGLVIATDAGTGAIKWVFNTIPQRPQDQGWEIARDTWGDGARAGGGIWTQPAVDPELGMVYVNAGNPSPDYDGSARVGINLFTNSTIALDLETGDLRWYFQAVHHDLWDWDHVTGPVLFDVTDDDWPGDQGRRGGREELSLLHVGSRNRRAAKPDGRDARPHRDGRAGRAGVADAADSAQRRRGADDAAMRYLHRARRSGARESLQPVLCAVLDEQGDYRCARGLELGRALVQSAHRARLRDREERRHLDRRQAGRRHPPTWP